MVKFILTYFLIQTIFSVNAQKKRNTEILIKNLEQMSVQGILNADTNILKNVDSKT